MWFNDDINFYFEVIEKLFLILDEIIKIGVVNFVIVGLICDLEIGNLIYGGMICKIWWYLIKYNLI